MSPKARKAKKPKAPKKEYHHLPARTEAEQFQELSEELCDAWAKLREILTAFGEQRIHTSHRAIMFSRKTCYAFVRPKKSYLELCFFLKTRLKSEIFKKVEATSKTKFGYIVALKHADQIEAPLTEWLQHAFRESA